MKYTEKIIENSILQNEVLCIWEMKGELPPAMNVSSRIVPKAQHLIVFNFGDTIKYSKEIRKANTTNCYCVTASAQSFMLEQKGHIHLLGISFIRDGLYKLLQTPLKEITNNWSQLVEKFDILREQLQHVDFNECTGTIEQFLIEHRNSNISNQAFDRAMNLMESSKGNVSIQDVAKHSKVTIRQLQRLFSVRLGLSPKAFCKITRLNHYLDTILATAENIDWMDIVEKFDYHDQPHLIKEVKSLVQLSPQQLVQYRDTLYHHYKD